MKRFYQILIVIFCSLSSSGCYLYVVSGNATINNPENLIPPLVIGMILAIVFVIISAIVTLQTENKERRDAALLIAGAATAVGLLLLG